jgi:2-dehydro-3-deoxyphosphooctonate aldolase (KDO 8-P synthase)
MSQQKNISISCPQGSKNGSEISVNNDAPMVLFSGMNVLESKDLAFEVAQHHIDVCSQLNIPYVFKASFDKANRSSLSSFRGPGLEKGLQILADIKSHFSVPVITDVHEPSQAQAAADVVDVIQLPAFLSRQTDLVKAMADTQAIINIKKAQFLAPHEMKHILHKFEEAGNDKLMLCERGTMFGYNNLVVDTLGFEQMKSFNYPLIFDVTHALQIPGGRSDSAGGRRAQVLQLARAGLSQKIAGLFLETHPDPEQALCDGPCALPLKHLKAFLEQLKHLDDLVKGLEDINFA